MCVYVYVCRRVSCYARIAMQHVAVPKKTNYACLQHVAVHNKTNYAWLQHVAVHNKTNYACLSDLTSRLYMAHGHSQFYYTSKQSAPSQLLTNLFCNFFYMALCLYIHTYIHVSVPCRAQVVLSHLSYICTVVLHTYMHTHMLVYLVEYKSLCHICFNIHTYIHVRVPQQTQVEAVGLYLSFPEAFFEPRHPSL
jgi:hypothetical protein